MYGICMCVSVVELEYNVENYICKYIYISA